MTNDQQNMPPPRNGRIDDAKEKIPKHNKYNFQLIHRGSRDGFNVTIMCKKCEKKGAFILIIKTNESDAVIGGYNHFGIKLKRYGSCEWVNTTDSFIFSLDDRKDLKISRVANQNYANYGLNFGDSDLVITGNAGTCKQKYYESKILDTDKFTIKEMEVFTFKVE
ncbi:3539_t:CDS:2 [Funneliformis mosseae]|uniref:3539_t:CDS:1 n=1 Tax=Funneliformis mosseae TaxID=27381 RepID=A0A9N8WGX3_FUNMO|nr:3539_t:CDS:2 [Funneliformis mosseae]